MKTLAELRGFSAANFIRGPLGEMGGSQSFSFQAITRQLAPKTSLDDGLLAGNLITASTRGWGLFRTTDTNNGATMNFLARVYSGGIAQDLSFAVPASLGKFTLFTLSYSAGAPGMLTIYVNGVFAAAMTTGNDAFNVSNGRFSAGYNVNDAANALPEASIVAMSFGSNISAVDAASNMLEVYKRSDMTDAGLTTPRAFLYSVQHDAGVGRPTELLNYGASAPDGILEVVGTDVVLGTPRMAWADFTPPQPAGGVIPAFADPVSIGTVNQPGVAPTLVRSDHIHAHGDLPGGTLHALATILIAGFMSPADKLKLENLILTSQLDLYVASTGNDANDGLTPGTAVLTLSGAYSKVIERAQAYLLAAPVVIHIAAFPGGAPLAWVPIPGFVGVTEDAQVILYGDGAGQGVEDGFTVVATGTVAAGTTDLQIVPTVPVVADAFEGLWVQIVDGPSAGSIRQVRNNGTNLIVPVYDFTAVPAVGNTFRILRPATVVDVIASPSLMDGSVSATVVNLDFQGAVDIGVFNASPAKLFGVYLSASSVTIVDSEVFVGVGDFTALGFENVLRLAELWVALGFIGDWDGWGVSADTALCSGTRVNKLTGFVVAPYVETHFVSTLGFFGGHIQESYFLNTRIACSAVSGNPILFGSDGVGNTLFAEFSEVQALSASYASDFTLILFTSYAEIFTYVTSGAGGLVVQAGSSATVFGTLNTGFINITSSDLTWDAFPAGATLSAVTNGMSVFFAGRFSVFHGTAAKTITITNPAANQTGLRVSDGAICDFGDSPATVTGTSFGARVVGGVITSRTSMSFTATAGVGADVSASGRLSTETSCTCAGTTNGLAAREAGLASVRTILTANGGSSAGVSALSNAEVNFGENSSITSTGDGGLVARTGGEISFTGTNLAINANTTGIDCSGGGTCNLNAVAGVVIVAGGDELVVGPSIVERSALALALPNAGDSFSNIGGGCSINRNV